MHDALAPATPTRLYEQLIERLRSHVSTEGLAVGDRLPPERELAARLQVSRASVKQALLILEVQGAIATRHGGGSYLLREGAAGPETVAELIERRNHLPQALEARHALEAKCAQLAAVRRTETDLAAMEHALEAMAADLDDAARVDEATRTFHDAVNHAAHNEVLLALMDQIASFVGEIRHESLSQPGRPTKSLAEHHALLAAIRARDPKAAVAAVDAHMATIAQVRLLDWTPPDGAAPDPLLLPYAG